MEIGFAFELHGRDWWKAFVPVWIVYVAYASFNLYGNRALEQGASPGAFLALGLLFFIAFVLVFSAFAIVILRLALPKLSLGGNALGFQGSIPQFLGLNLLGLALTIVTLGIYGPWYLRKVVDYLCAETRFLGEAVVFKGRGGRLLLYYLLAFWLPFIVVLVALFLALGPDASGVLMLEASRTLVVSGFTVLMIVLMVPFMYLVYRWYVNLGWKEYSLAWETGFWDSCLYILGQLCLTVLTLGIYWPAATLKLYRYFAGRTVLSRDGQALGHLEFEGRTTEGFGLIWGQTLLSLVTLGFYLPWAYARIGRWLAAATVYRGEALESEGLARDSFMGV